MWNIYIRPFLEAAYFIASIGLVVGIWIGIKQLKLLQKDTKDKYKRAAVEKSIEYLNWFATDYIPKIDQFNHNISQSKLKVYSSQINPKFRFDVNCNLDQPETLEYLIKTDEYNARDLMNQLEYFSAALVSGLADEELMFNPIARTFCSFVEKNYIDICYYRREETCEFYSNIIELYDVWKSRLKKIELESEKMKLENNISKISERHIQSIGS